MTHHLAYQVPIGGLDVVLVEDHRGTQALLRSMLLAFRVARVRAFDNAEEAIRSMIVEPPSVVITDWEMRPVSGLKMLSVMRQVDMKPLCFVPALMVTGHATLPKIEQAFSAGIHHMLVKPLAPDALLSRLNWLTRDDRHMIQQGDRWVIEGLDHIVQNRIRHVRDNGQSGLMPRPSDATLTQNELIDEMMGNGKQAPRPVNMIRRDGEDHEDARRSNDPNWRGWRVQV